MVSGVLPLQARGLELRRGGKRLLGPLDLTLAGPGLTAVIGPNGAGKTSLLRALHGLDRPSAGTVSSPVTEAERRAAQAFVFQTPVMLRRSVAENLAFPLRLAGRPRPAREAAVDAWLSRIGLAERPGLPAQRLSGGERRKLALARALITQPQLLFLDEPCASLDGRATREIETLLQEACGTGTRIVLATHDLGQARRLATEALFLLHGRLHESGPAASFFTTPQTPELRAFLKGDIVE